MKQLDFGMPVGEAFGPLTYDLTPEAISRYVDAVEDDHPWYFGDSPFNGPIVPPLMAALYNVGVLRQAFEIPPGSIHARQVFEFTHPARPRTRVRTHGRVLDKYVKRGRPYIEIEAASTDETGEELTRGVLVMVLPEKQASEGEEEKGRAQSQGTTNKEPTLCVPTSTLTPLQRKVTQETINRYAAASGDNNPIHTDESYARKAGLGRTIAQGFLILAYVSALMMHALGRGWAQGGRLSVTFIAPVRPGDTVCVHGMNVRRDMEEGPARLTFQVWCENQRREKVLAGTASGLEYVDVFSD